MKEFIKKIPIIGGLARNLYSKLRNDTTQSTAFSGSSIRYWQERYATGGQSGVGSYGKFAHFKADVLNKFVATHNLRSVIEFGCGDGNQLTLAKYPHYVGFDISETVVAKCKRLFAADSSKHFGMISEYKGEKGDVAISLDVIYHLVEDDVFEVYMTTLFASSDRFVIVYASDSDDNQGYEGTHVRHRKFTRWIEQNQPSWKLLEHIPNKYPYQGDYREGSFADFFIYARA